MLHSGRMAHRKYSAITEASDRFRKFRPEDEKIRRNHQVREDLAVKAFISAWKSFRHSGNFASEEDQFSSYVSKIKTELNGIPFRSNDLMNAALALAVFQDDAEFQKNAGLALSALISAGIDSEYVLEASILPYGQLRCFGSFNEKSITVIGDLERMAGLYMNGGTLEIFGDVEDSLGQSMKSGKIIVHGNAEDEVGIEMTNGTIAIGESAGNDFGRDMHGGLIHIKGNVYGSVATKMHGGEIIIDGQVISRSRNVPTMPGMHSFCQDMDGGIVRLNGNYKRPDRIKGGQVFHKGVLMVNITSKPEKKKKSPPESDSD